MPDLDEEEGVKVLGLSKKYLSGSSYIDILRNVNFVAKKGKITMITGPSGSGKTTLLCIIASILKFDEGIVRVLGKDIGNLTSDERTEFRKSNIGFIFQQFHLIRTLSVLENVSVPLILLGHSKEEIVEKAHYMIEKVGLKEQAHRKIGMLSGGEQQRVAIARALIHEPPIIICDEPTASLDAVSGGIIMQIFEDQVKAPDRCVIIVTHDNRIYKYADSIAKIEDGIIISQLEIEKKE